jgi:exopolysaccharide production protein ExoQ
MSAAIATVAYALIILGFLKLDRDRQDRPSPWLWLPVVWLCLAGSRSVSQWLQLGQPMEATEHYLEGNPVDRFVYTGLLAIGLIVVAKRGERVWKLLQSNRAVLIFFLYGAASLFWSDYPDVAFKRWTKALGDLVMVLLVLSDRNPGTAIKQFLSRTTYFLIPLSVLFVKYYPNLGRNYGKWLWETRYTGVTTNKNSLGMICLLFGLASAWRFLFAFKDRQDAARSRKLVAHGVILAMVLWLFWIANSMTSLGCFMLAGALLLATSIRKIVQRPAIVHLSVIGVVLASAAILFLGFNTGVLETMGRDPTLTDRTAIWSLVLGMTTSPLFGTGFESFWLGPRLEKIWSEYTWGPAEAHNGYIEVFLQLGWIGIILLAIVILTGYKKVTSALQRNHPTAGLMLAYFVVGVVYNFTEAAFFRMMAPAWILFLLAIAGSPDLMRSEDPICSSKVLCWGTRTPFGASDPLIPD